ncbi:hypothetical protein [Prochlorococcus sp. MIT 1223]|uniref:hypothetical protein n=1 Tax=Prochlorococcus sp. MIT 1223 TaxID=3096217 RepID=UPI002A747D34|nr:hypothetical protein [Prochlorococcus sp. MIT 1223]
MDICLINTQEGIEIRPKSIHGILWLQTHFEEQHWEAISNNEVRIPTADAKDLSLDAQEAGLILNCFPVISSKTGIF